MAESGILGAEETGDGSSLPWTQRFTEALPVAPAWGGLLLAFAHFSFGVGYAYLARGPDGVLSSLGAFPVFAALVGFAPAASVYSRRATRACLRDLRPALDVSDSRFAELVDEVTRWDTSWARFVGLISAAGTFVIVLNEPAVVERYPLGHPMLPLVLWMNLAAIWLSSRTLAQEMIVSRRFARLGRDHALVDLLHQRPLAPFARRGVQGALVAILSISIFSLLFVSGSAGDAVPFTQLLVVTLAAIAFVLPVLGVHRRLADQKLERLTRLAGAIRDAEEPVIGGRPGETSAEAAHLQVLLALREQVDRAREWPWDVPTLVRFALYVAIGLGSWLGGALVERIVDWALG
jgi:hypothetical protein